MKRTIAVAVFAGFGLLIYSSYGDRQEAAAETQARAVIDALFDAFNRRDSAGYHATFHYPQATIAANGRLAVASEAPEAPFNFEALAAREGWHHSRIDSVEALGVSPQKVHFDVQFSRYQADGSAYAVWRGLWIITRREGRWGVQARSFMPIERVGRPD